MNKRLKIILALVVVCSLVLLTVGCGEDHPAATENGETAQNVGTEAPDDTSVSNPETETEPAIPGRKIETAYFTLTIPGEYEEHIEHREVTEGQTVMEMFSMTKAGDTWELFRIYLGDSEIGKEIGFLQMDGERLAITITVCHYPSDAFPDTETVELYAQTMGLLNHVLDTIRDDSRYVDQDELPVKKKNEMLIYWAFDLPENMQCEETTTDDVYRAVFYGLVNGEKHELYTVMVGEPAFETILGMYDIGGNERTISIESNELPDTQGWTSEDEMELYVMMDSINDVIQVIMSSDGFTTDVPQG